MGEQFQIRVRSYEVFDPLVTDPAVHNEIVFMRDDDVVAALNGDPRDRSTGNINFPSLSNMDTLRVRAIPGLSMKEFAPDFPMFAEAVLFEGGEEEFLEHLAAATDAAQFINAQNMDYIMLGLPESQNSNSVAHTLATAMGLEYPPEIDNLWAPGHDRILLPENWQPPSSRVPPEQLMDYTVSQLKQLEEIHLAQDVRADPDPYADRSPHDENAPRAGQFFDPNNAVMPDVNIPEDTEPSPPPAHLHISPEIM